MLTQAQFDQLIQTGRVDTSPAPVVVPERPCVEFRISPTRSYWALLPADAPIPTTWEAAERTATGSVCLEASKPHNWKIVATVARPGPRCIALAHPQRGTCYVPIRDGAPVPQTLAGLKTAALGRGTWQPQGEIVNTIKVYD